MAWTTPSTAVAGSTALTAAFWNEQVRDNSAYLKAEADAVGLVRVTAATSISGSSFSVNNCFTSDFDHYRVIFEGLTGSTTTQLVYIRLRAAGSDNSTASSYGRRGFASTSGGVVTSGESTNQFLVTEADSTNVGRFIMMDFLNPALAIRTSFLVNGLAGGLGHWSWVGFHTQTTAYDGFTIYPVSGTLTGTLTVYGYGKG